jgi:quercetin dioxygenase-like cupin family protein
MRFMALRTIAGFTSSLPIALTLTATFVVCAPARTFAADTKRMAVVPREQAKFVPADPARPDGAQIAVLWGDPATGPSAMLMKFGKTDGALHTHTSDYHLMLLEGQMKHWVADSDRAKSPVLGPGSYWFQPGGDPHGDSCLSDECVMFIQWSGKRDGKLVR